MFYHLRSHSGRHQSLKWYHHKKPSVPSIFIFLGKISIRSINVLTDLIYFRDINVYDSSNVCRIISCTLSLEITVFESYDGIAKLYVLFEEKHYMPQQNYKVFLLHKIRHRYSIGSFISHAYFQGTNLTRHWQMCFPRGNLQAKH